MAPRRVAPESYPRAGSDEFARRMLAAGHCMNVAGVRVIYLVHGTFVGADALGIYNELARLLPGAADLLRSWNKSIVDMAAGETGNYTDAYARQLESALGGTKGAGPRVKRFGWSSENHHLGRADGAVRLLNELADQSWQPGDRVLLWGHSHAGNVFALLSNLLRSDRAAIDAFFAAARDYYQWPLWHWTDVPAWQTARDRLTQPEPILPQLSLDVVTFGTPVRYGWETAGYARLLHLVNDRSPTRPADNGHFPPTLGELMHATEGDYVQRFGIAGTNLSPGWLSPRVRLADSRLHRLLQRDVPSSGLAGYLRARRRVAEEGLTLLVDYGPAQGSMAEHLLGHAVYTRAEWMLFHAEEVARHWYTLS